MRTAARLPLAILVTFAVLPAQAETSSYRRGDPQPRAAYGSYQSSPAYQSRAIGPYARPPGYDGTIRWNTPNANGNLGGPGAGGAGPGG